MTPDTQEQHHGSSLSHALWLMFFGAAIYYLIAVPMVMIAWNAGLQNAGIVEQEIDWITAFGLAMVLGLVRSVVQTPRIH